jgi:hypothetical protein
MALYLVATLVDHWVAGLGYYWAVGLVYHLVQSTV